MIESILHFLGLCPDNFSHPNLLMFLGSATGIWFGLKYLWPRIWHNKIAVVDTETRGLDGNAQILVLCPCGTFKNGKHEVLAVPIRLFMKGYTKAEIQRMIDTLEVFKQYAKDTHEQPTGD